MSHESVQLECSAHCLVEKATVEWQVGRVARSKLEPQKAHCSYQDLAIYTEQKPPGLMQAFSEFPEFWQS